KSNQLNECSRGEIINAYDNAILYTDYFLSRVIDLLQKNSGRANSSSSGVNSVKSPVTFVTLVS
ncbi:MAG: hypothetical protein P8075_16960, partial [Deltaproteobacteria bacterium]